MSDVASDTSSSNFKQIRVDPYYIFDCYFCENEERDKDGPW